MAAESSSSLPPLIIESDDEVDEIIEEVRSTSLAPKDPQYPHKPVYCGTCSLPPQYCCNLAPKSRFEECWAWLAVNAPEVYPDLPKWMAAKTKQVQKVKKTNEANSKAFFRWAEIPAFSSLKLILSKFPDLNRTLSYRGKIKLHGTNASVVIQSDGGVFAQRRNGVISVASSSEKDADSNFGFGPFIYNNPAYWQALIKTSLAEGQWKNAVIFGEWCGRGIMNGAAICTIPTRHFAVFCIVLDHTYTIDDPEQIRAFLKLGAPEFVEKAPREMLVVPWIPEVFHYDFSWLSLNNQDPEKTKAKEAMQLKVNEMNTLVAKVDRSDPFVLATFGVDGVGEGIVCYPQLLAEEVNGVPNLGRYKLVSALIFKAKGKSHRVMASKDAATIDSAIASSINEFVDMFVTPQRCDQGYVETCSHISETWKLEDLGAFVTWISKDVQKEGKEELGTLNPKQADKAVKARATKWFEEKMESLSIPNLPQ